MTLPVSSATTTMSWTFRRSYAKPDGLITMSPRLRSIPLALPQVWMTKPSLTRSRLAFQTSRLSFGFNFLPGFVSQSVFSLHHAGCHWTGGLQMRHAPSGIEDTVPCRVDSLLDSV